MQNRVNGEKVMRKPLSLIVLLGLSAAAFGQTAPPALMVKVDGKSQPLGLTKLDTNVRIYGYLAETTTTMTFLNLLDRVMEGDLYFPLPEGSTISGYALDIEGRMIDGVAVEKDKGRQVFEKIVRQGIDPGLIEWTKGNNFKTRVFPIPAKGTRTIRVSYVSEFVGGGGGAPGVYRLPLKFKDKVGEFTIKMEVVKPLAEPTVQQGGLAGFGFEKWRDSFIAETKLEEVELDKDLFIALPGVEKLDVLIERADDGQTYFAVHDYPELPQSNGSREMPRHLVVYWDASGSRGAIDHSREIELLGMCLNSLLPQDRKSQGFTVDLVVFRNAAAKPKRFRWTKRNDRGPNDNDALLKSIETLQYDGGTQMSAITPPKGAPQPDLCLLFTDGLSNFGKEKPSRLQCPLYAFSMDAAVNHNFLKQLAAATGGRYFNLNRMKNDEVLAAFGKPTYSFLGAEADSAEVEEPYPRLPQPVAGRFTLVGRLVGESATISLNYGYAGLTPTAQRTRDRLPSRRRRRHVAEAAVGPDESWPNCSSPRSATKKKSCRWGRSTAW
jgi:Ca-activated chloride channel family protein